MLILADYLMHTGNQKKFQQEKNVQLSNISSVTTIKEWFNCINYTFWLLVKTTKLATV